MAFWPEAKARTSLISARRTSLTSVSTRGCASLLVFLSLVPFTMTTSRSPSGGRTSRPAAAHRDGIPCAHRAQRADGRRAYRRTAPGIPAHLHPRAFSPSVAPRLAPVAGHAESAPRMRFSQVRPSRVQRLSDLTLPPSSIPALLVIANRWNVLSATDRRVTALGRHSYDDL
ncbi:hypothetical protein B0H14DRAFT_2787759 [Mycena olivaceomarginata]|nr:hypothetical protein B0H14DRAFT_2787759 [Mycena olivaceomarginata]